MKKKEAGYQEALVDWLLEDLKKWNEDVHVLI